MRRPNTRSPGTGPAVRSWVGRGADEQLVDGPLHNVIGRRRISAFIESLCRPHVLGKELEAGYQQMAQDEEHEAEALEWAEAAVGDVGDEEK